MPEAADPLSNLGYLVAAVAVTLAALIGYALSLARRLAAAAERNARLRRGAASPTATTRRPGEADPPQ